MSNIRRRDLLAGTALLVIQETVGRAAVVTGRLPWEPNAGSPPSVVGPGPWQFFTDSEGAAIEVIADHLIPPDPQTPGGKDAGCAVFIDRQLAGPYGASDGLYTSPPFSTGEKSQGPQSPSTPREMYRTALQSLERHCQAQDGKGWTSLALERQDALLHRIDTGDLALEGVDSKVFFTLLLKDLQEGFFADPVYGGNRDMCAWKMIGFPGAHYDYRDWVLRHNERYPHAPVSIAGRPGWNVTRG